MNIELFLENQRVEVEKVDFPLNKTFQNLINPTDIIVDYSKTISIPMTKQNNKVLGNAYRLDKIILSSDKENIGMYLDPTKKIPFRLVYNNDLLMEGYAKFNNAEYNTKKKCYNMTLFGTIGDIFQKMRDVVLDEKKLPTELGKEYVLNDYLSGDALTPARVNYTFSYYDYNPISDLINDSDIIGFIPAYRGLYKEFDSKKVQTSSTSAKDLVTYINESIRPTYLDHHFRTVGESEEAYQARMTAEIEALKFGDVVGDGFKDYQMGEYRMNQQKPAVFIHSLFEMYQKKMKELTGYDLEVDNFWANETNPYWARMCYTLNFLNEKPNAQGSSLVAEASNSLYKSASQKEAVCVINKDISSLADAGNIILDPHKITVNGQFQSRTTYDDGLTDVKLVYYKNGEVCSNVLIDISCTLKDGTTRHKYFWSGYHGASYNINLPNYDRGNYVNCTMSQEKSRSRTINHFIIDLPLMDLGGDIDTTKPLVYTIKSIVSGSLRMPYSHFYHLEWWTHPTHHEGRPGDQDFDPVGHDAYEDIQAASGDFNVDISNIYANTSWRNNIEIKLKNFYKEERPLFDVLLDYTKMFGLIWDCDDVNRKIYLKSRYTYFKDYTITDWTNKVDKSKDFIIEPVSFGNKYVNFNYKDTDGHNYKDYKDKFGVNYGEKLIKTSYDFNSETKDLFKNIYPSCVSNRSFITLNDILTWDTTSQIIPNVDFLARIDADSADKKSSININNWYLRGGVQYTPNDAYITDDTQYQLEHGYCWIDPKYLASSSFPAEKKSYVNTLPEYNLVYQKGTEYYGCIFNRPNIDYTKDKEITKAGNHYIFDYCWKDYLNERYSVQNKKLTCYLDIKPTDWSEFKFNNFIQIDNQLFIVNKIMDYNPNNKTTTKVELIQVTDINAYKKTDYLTNIVSDTYSINFKDIESEYKTIQIYSYPSITSENISFEYDFDQPSTSMKISIDDWESVGEGGEGITLSFDGFGTIVGTFAGRIVINNGISELKIPFKVEITKAITIATNPDSIYASNTANYNTSLVATSTPRPDSIHIEDSKPDYVGKATITGVTPLNDNSVKVSMNFTGFETNLEYYTGSLVISNGTLTKRVPLSIDNTGYELPITTDVESLSFTDLGRKKVLVRCKSNPKVNAARIENAPSSEAIKIGNIFEQSGEIVVPMDMNFIGVAKGTYNCNLIVGNGRTEKTIPITVTNNGVVHLNTNPRSSMRLKVPTSVGLWNKGTFTVDIDSYPAIRSVTFQGSGSTYDGKHKVEKVEKITDTLSRYTISYDYPKGEQGIHNIDIFTIRIYNEADMFAGVHVVLDDENKTLEDNYVTVEGLVTQNTTTEPYYGGIEVMLDYTASTGYPVYVDYDVYNDKGELDRSDRTTIWLSTTKDWYNSEPIYTGPNPDKWSISITDASFDPNVPNVYEKQDSEYNYILNIY